MSIYKIYQKLVLLVFFGYLLFIPVGPYPIAFLGTKLDIFFAVFLFVLLLPFLRSALSVYPLWLTFSLLFYFSVTFASVVFSQDLSTSLMEWSVIAGYSVVAFLAPVALLRYRDSAGMLLLLAALATSAVIFWYSFSGDYSIQGRFYFGQNLGLPMSDDSYRVDPNHTAIGLMLSLFIFMTRTSIRDWGASNFVMFLPFVGVVLVAALLTLSRTALVASVMALILAAGTMGFRGITGRKDRYVLWSAGLIVAILLVAGVVVSAFSDYALKLADRLLSATGDSARLSLYSAAWDDFTASSKNVVLGKGFMLLNPHNEYVRHLSGGGFLGWLSFIVLLFSIYIFAVYRCGGSFIRQFSAVSLFWYICIAVTFYPLIKPFWVAVLFLLFIGAIETHRPYRSVP